ncbi:aminotransferase [Bifidobacterium aemilianum]|uniref:alanine transaminase n=1 Tax=Bifidobacterium aemilianum TaxID=2493120 RepID=A0A366K9I5_9BIFI|nr:pyridoxal phosphate-dependent aminotransferase [Bifidobacterium aemilianum]RBP98386.1 aminotransferase [Bifidobacterium aemilianum]
MRFSSRVDISDPNPIAQAEAKAKAQGLSLRRLNDSNPTRHGLSPAQIPTVYSADPRGPQAARRALAQFLSERQAPAGSGQGQEGAGVDPDSLYLLSSTSQAYSWLIKLLCDAGDAILAPAPGYPLIDSIARLECAQALQYRLVYDGSWWIDLAALRSQLEGPQGQRIRALVVINPNNPTGSYAKPEERRELVALCSRHEIALIADEVFFDYDLEPLPGRSRFAGESGVLTFALDGFSKMLAAPQAKVGWIQVSGPAGITSQAQRRLDMIADDYLPMSDIIVERIPDLLAAAPAHTAMVKARTQANLKTLRGLLASDPRSLLTLERPEGGWNVLVRMPAALGEDRLVLDLIDQHGLSGQPGYFFDMVSNGYMAVSLLPEPEPFASNIKALQESVNRLLG